MATCGNETSPITPEPPVIPEPPIQPQKKDIVLGAERLDEYLPLIQGKKVALTINHTSVIGDTHLVDFLREQSVDIVRIFAPEHGFRGEADAGEKVTGGKDPKTGLPIVSLYGSRKKPLAEDMAGLDYVIFDIQDVGARFYTYISTMHYVMEAAAENGVKVIILDRPNPNGHYVAGPVLEPEFSSFVGMHPIPVVHGLTVGELAMMINGEGWLKNGLTCDLRVISCENYDHSTPYSLPIKPSPNLPNMKSIYLYPTLCFFEGTQMSIGRGTDLQFQVIGSPFHPEEEFSFTPEPKPGAKNPKHNGIKCKGVNLAEKEEDILRSQGGINWEYLLHFYATSEKKSDFFNRKAFFDKLAGTDSLRKGFEAKKTIQDIEKEWSTNLNEYKYKRKQYLLYPDNNG